MALTQQQINKSAVMAALIVNDQSDQLDSLLLQLRTEALRQIFAESLQSQLVVGSDKAAEPISMEFVTDLVDRIHKSVQYKLELQKI